MNEISKSKEISHCVHTLLLIFIGTIVGCLLGPDIESLTFNIPHLNKLIFVLFCILTYLIIDHLYRQHYTHLSTKEMTLAILIFLTIPIVWLSMTHMAELISCILILMSISALLSTVVRIAFLKSILIAVPAITLGVVVGSSGVIFAENTINYGNPIADANVIAVDHSLALPDISGNYPVKATEYIVVRDDNGIRIEVPGIPRQKTYQIPKDVVITFNGQSILPDGRQRHITLERGKSYTLTLED